VCVLLEHRYRLQGGMAPESERSMCFYDEARVDGLQQRAETSTQMTEHYVHRDDCLVYRHVEFAGRQKKFGPADNAVERPILVGHRQSCSNSTELYSVRTVQYTERSSLFIESVACASVR